MILLVEKDTLIRKKLCDILNRERIIGVATKQQVLEALVQHRNKLKVLIVNAFLLSEILSEETILKLCLRLSITVPPIVVLFKPEQKAIIESINNSTYQFEFVEFDQKNNSFPTAYVKAIKKLYPQLHIDMDMAKTTWQKSEASQDLNDIRKWLKEGGFTEAVEIKKFQKQPEKTTKTTGDDSVDYKKLYLELKEKYNKLVADFEELKKIFEE